MGEALNMMQYDNPNPPGILKLNENICNSMIFSLGNVPWFFRISKEGIFFNKEAYPDFIADDFAKAFVDILEKSYDLKFEKREVKNLGCV